MAKETEDSAGKNITDITDNIKEIFFQGDISQDTLNEIMGDNIRNNNEALLACLREKLKKAGTHQVLPVLGAGISVPAGIPTWDRLLDNMWYRQMEIDLADPSFPDDALRNRFFLELKKRMVFPPHGGDLLEYAQYFRNKTDSVEKDRSDKLFINTIHKGFQYPDKTWDREAIEALENRPLGYMARLIGKCHLNVITYNFDDLLEAYFKVKMGGTPFRCIQDSQEMYLFWDTETIKVYHVHGCIPLTDFSDAVESQRVVFAESEYLRAETYSYDWLNAVQAERIHRKDMMIVGFSAQDYNFKRILRNLSPLSPEEVKKADPTKADMRAHYIFLPVEDFLKEVRLPDALKVQLLKAKGFQWPEDLNIKVPGSAASSPDDWRKYIILMIRMFMNYKRDYLRYSGIYPIWTSYETLSSMLKGLTP